MMMHKLELKFMKGPGRPPIYPTIADELERRISRGVYTHEFPSYRAIVKEFHISSRTADKALDRLRSRGLIYSRIGIGTFVTPRDYQK
jgi:DNA-binding GntR family transcriptional regulator